MLPRVKGSNSSKVRELGIFDENDPTTWKFYFLIYFAQFFGYREVVEMPIPNTENEDANSERVQQFGKINGKLIAVLTYSNRRVSNDWCK